MDSTTAVQEMRDARLALGLSQGSVARDTGLSRSQLSLFEGRKYVLDRAKLEKLKSYYEKRGYRFGDPTKTLRVLNPRPPAGAVSTLESGQSDLDLLDGFGVASGIERQRAEAWLNQIAANDDTIIGLLETAAPIDIWTGDPKTADRDEALLQMARNYALVRRLHGKEMLPPPRSAKDKETLTGDLVRELFWGKDLSDNTRPAETHGRSKRRKRRVNR